MQKEEISYLATLLNTKFDEETARRFLIYTENLLEWNKVLNLTAITEPREIIIKHYYDSIFPFLKLDLRGKSLIDVGTGAGFPALPLKILFPSLKITLLDSLNKRLNFLRDTCEKLGFLDVTYIHTRAEQPPKGLREDYDIATARAVASLNILSEYCLPYVKKGGFFIALKGQNAEDELQNAKNAIRILGGAVRETISFDLPENQGARRTFIIEKIASTPSQYPRKTPMIEKKPL